MTEQQLPPPVEQTPHEQESQELYLQEQHRIQEDQRVEGCRAEIHHGIVKQMLHAFPGMPGTLDVRQGRHVAPIIAA